MNELAWNLLKNRGVLILPEEIDHETYQMVVSAVLERPKDTIHLYCRGDGGYTRDTFSIIDLIQAHGKFVGILPGVAASSHAIIFAACASRIIYDYSNIGFHRVVTSNIPYVDAPAMQQMGEYNEWADRNSAKILAAATNEDVDYWMEKIASATLGLYWMDAAEIIRVGLGKPGTLLVQR
jgi:ATP-dependent protease ClpP protease subunit